jgi:hypothetical protein
VRPSSDDIEALIAPLQNLLEAEKHTHFEMPSSTNDAEMNVVLSLLAGESSDSARSEPTAFVIEQDFGEDEEIQTRRCSPQAFTPSEPSSCTYRGEEKEKATLAVVMLGAGCWPLHTIPR